MRLSQYILFALPAFTLASCSNHEPDSESAGRAAVVTAEIGEAASRASVTDWAPGDRIGISGTTESEPYCNVQYTTDGSGQFSSTDGIFFNSNKPAAFSAYYPYKSGITAENTVITASTADQSKSADFDFLFASGAIGSISNPALNFTGEAAFKHRMAQLVINITANADDGFIGTDVLNNAICTVSGLLQEGEFDSATGSATATSSSAADISLDPSLTYIKDRTATHRLIFFPQTAGDVELSIELEGGTYTCTFTPRLEAGKSFTANFTLKRSGLSLGQVSITDWIRDNYIMMPGTGQPLHQQKIEINGHDAVLMRKAVGKYGDSDYVPALYVATSNIGTEEENGVGTYFWWGDVEGHTSGFVDSNTAIITNHKTRQQLFEDRIIDADGNLLPEYDAATVLWGGNWRLPTHEDWAWIGDVQNCTWTYVHNSTPCGYWMVKSKTTGGVILLPNVGYMEGSSVKEWNNYTEYGGATIFPEDGAFNKNNDRFYGISMYFDSHNGSHDAIRHHGRNLRPVASI